MRTILAVLMLATAAAAAPLLPTAAPPLGIDAATVPAPCTPFLQQAVVPAPVAAMTARISLAQCIAGERLRAHRDLIDAQDSIELVDESVAASVALLDAVIATDVPRLVIEAQHAKGELYAQMIARMLATLPAPAAGAGDDAMQLREQRVAVLATWLQPWRDAAHDAFAGVVTLGKQHPELARDPVVQQAIRDSSQRLEREPAKVATSS